MESNLETGFTSHVCISRRPARPPGSTAAKDGSTEEKSTSAVAVGKDTRLGGEASNEIEGVEIEAK